MKCSGKMAEDRDSNDKNDFFLNLINHKPIPLITLFIIFGDVKDQNKRLSGWLFFLVMLKIKYIIFI